MLIIKQVDGASVTSDDGCPAGIGLEAIGEFNTSDKIVLTPETAAEVARELQQAALRWFLAHPKHEEPT